MTEKIYRLNVSGLSKKEISSPMDPPAAYDLHKPLSVPFEQLSEPLKVLVKEHEQFLSRLDSFESALMLFKEQNFSMTPSTSVAFRKFFQFFDEEVHKHNAKEEKALFPVLKPLLIKSGECSTGTYPRTATDLMEEDHIKVLQSVTLIFNFLGIGKQLKDLESRNTVFHYAVEQGRDVIETMRLHIFKENQVLFPLAEKLIPRDQLDSIFEMMKPYLQ